VAKRAFAVAARAQPRIVCQRQVNDSSLASIRGIHCHRAPGLTHAGSEAPGRLDQLATTAFAVSFGIQQDSPDALVPPLDEPVQEVLERIERLPMAADEQPPCLARDAQPDFPGFVTADRIDPRAEPHELKKARENADGIVAGPTDRPRRLGRPRGSYERLNDDGLTHRDTHSRRLAAEAENPTAGVLHDLHLCLLPRDCELGEGIVDGLVDGFALCLQRFAVRRHDLLFALLTARIAA
jgi:hypothetical protein